MSRISSSSWNWMVLAGITALAAVLRLWQINESLWIDELHTSWCVQGSIFDVAPRAADGNQSPLYFWLVWGVTRLLGESEFTLRLPSLLAGIALPAMVWLLVRRLELGEKTALAAILAALLVCVDHASIFYSTEARPYALVELASAGAMILAFESLRGGFLWRVALVATFVALFYLHYTTALYIGGLIGCFLIQSFFNKDGKSSGWKEWLVIGGIAAACSLPASYQLLDIAARRGNWTVFEGDFSPARVYIPLVVLLALWSPLPPRRALLTAAVCLIPAIAAAGLTWWGIAAVFQTRYIVVTFPLLWVSIAAASQASDHPRVRQVAALVSLAVAIWWSGLVENCWNYGRLLVDRQEEWRSAVAAANQEYRQHPGWKVLVHSGLIETDGLRDNPTAALMEYGLLPVRAIYELDVADSDLIALPMTQPELLTAETREAVLRAGGAIVLLRQSADQAEAVAKELDSFGIIKRQPFGGVQVIAIEVSIEP
ncbi:MAG: glycosyltransferase family 39 protein [Planctomycetales bacterium]|nr:glycosyltransferase family 39 protein [Planctomycetales bacterium]